MRSAGMTLLEMLVVLAIIGILAAVGLGSYARWTQKMRAEAAVADVQRVFARAKARVRTSNRDVVVTIDPTNDRLTLAQGTIWTVAAPIDGDVQAWSCRTACETLAAGEISTAAGAAGDNIVRFKAPYGTLLNDVKVTLSYAGNVRDAYLLGPTAVLKVVRR